MSSREFASAEAECGAFFILMSYVIREASCTASLGTNTVSKRTKKKGLVKRLIYDNTSDARHELQGENILAVLSVFITIFPFPSISASGTKEIIVTH